MKRIYFFSLLLIFFIFVLVLLSFEKKELAFSQTVNIPIVQTLSANNISSYSATLNGYLDPKRDQVTYYFEYSQSSSSFDSITPLQSTSLTGNVSYTLYNLIPGKTYYFRLVAFNSYGKYYGDTFSFFTESNFINENIYLAVSTNPAQNIGRYEAVLWGLASTGNESRIAWFEYGTSPNNLNQRTHNITIFPSSYYYSQNLIPTFWATIGELNPATTYYYRAALAIGNNIVFGQVLNFTTLDENNYLNNQTSFSYLQEVQPKNIYLYPSSSNLYPDNYSSQPLGYSISFIPSHQYIYTGNKETGYNYYSSNNSLQASVLQMFRFNNNNLAIFGLILLFIISILLIVIVFKRK